MMETTVKMQALSKTDDKGVNRRHMQIIFGARDGAPWPGVRITFEDTGETLFIAADDFFRLVQLYHALCLPIMNEPPVLGVDFEKEIQARNDAAWKTLNPDKYKQG